MSISEDLGDEAEAPRGTVMSADGGSFANEGSEFDIEMKGGTMFCGKQVTSPLFARILDGFSSFDKFKKNSEAQITTAIAAVIVIICYTQFAAPETGGPVSGPALL